MPAQISVKAAVERATSFNPQPPSPASDNAQSRLQTMENTASIVREPSLDDSVPAPKRRKLRKGTQSCWECKRRKARCTFSAATKDVCEGCKRRGTECVSQESTDEPPPPGSKKGLVDRLGQVEALVGQLLKAARRDDLVSPAISEPRRRNYRDRSSRSQSPEIRSVHLVRQRACHDLSVR